MEKKFIDRANLVYETFCDALDEINWNYDRHDEDKVIVFGVNGEDIPMEFVAFIDVERQLIRLVSKLPFTFSEERRLDGSLAVNTANYKLIDGSFDYNFEDGSIYFKITTSFMDSLISSKLIHYMVECACSTVDEFNDKFYEIENGTLSIKEFVKKYC